MNQTEKSEVIVVAGDELSHDIAFHMGVKVVSDPGRCVNEARNIGVRASNGEYLVMLDADDVLDLSYVEKTLALADKSKSPYQMVRTHMQEFGIRNGFWDLPEWTYTGCLMSNQFCYSTLHSRDLWDIVGGQDPSLIAWEDWSYLSMCSEHADVLTVPERLLHYRVHEGNSTHTKHHLDQTARAMVVLANQEHYRPEYVAAQTAYLALKMPADAYRRLKERASHYPDARLLKYVITLAEECGKHE